MLYHIGLAPQDGAEYAILPGDPGRVAKIAAYLEEPQFVARNREYTTWSGTVKGHRVLVTSTGIGGPSAAIAVEELYQIGVRNFIRIGTCGGMQLEVCGGDLVVPTAAVRMEGTTKEYAPPEYPAVADYAMLRALVRAAGEQGVPVHTGVVQSKDSFYGQHSPQRMPVGTQLQENWQALLKCGCLASEMETAALFTVAGILRARAGCVLHVLWNQERAAAGLEDIHQPDTSKAIETAVQAIGYLIEERLEEQV